MHTIAIQRCLLSLLLIFACLANTAAWASAGVTSSGVSSTVGSTNPSVDVQSQSSNFVQQNQQNAASTGTAAIPATAMGRGSAADSSGTNGKNPGANSPPGADAKGKPGDPANAQAAAPAAPAAPPPTYVSNVKHLKSQTDTVAVVPAPDVAAAVPKPPKAEIDPTPAPPTPAVTPPVAPARSGNMSAAAKVDANAARRNAADTIVSTGGRGPAPDGYTFYIGVGIALLLLAFAFSAYLRSQKDEAAQRLPGRT